MNHYKIIFELTPAGWFGLPDDKRIVLPAGSFIIKKLTQSKSDIWFKISKYRDLDEAVEENYSSKEFKIEINENFLILHCKESTIFPALEYAEKIINTFIRLLQINYGQKFSYELIEIYKNEKIIPLPKTGYIKGMDIIAYDIKKLKESIKLAIEKINKVDAKALRFLEYFDRAIFINEFYDIEDPQVLNKRFVNFICTETYLNYYKALSVILGDPSIDNDYQSRYKSLGYDINFFNDKMEHFRKIRNQNDVSHYTMIDDELKYKVVKENLAEIRKVSVDVFLRYLEINCKKNNNKIV